MATTRLTKYEDLLAYLQENSVPHKPDPSARGVEIAVASGGVLWVKWEAELPYVQVIYPFIGGVPDDRVSEVESAICRVNTKVKLPGFGYEYGNHLIYMRLCVQLYDGGIEAAAFQRQMNAVLQNARELAGAFADVVKGAAASAVLDLAIKHNQPPAGST